MSKKPAEDTDAPAPAQDQAAHAWTWLHFTRANLVTGELITAPFLLYLWRCKACGIGFIYAKPHGFSLWASRCPAHARPVHTDPP